MSWTQGTFSHLLGLAELDAQDPISSTLGLIVSRFKLYNLANFFFEALRAAKSPESPRRHAVTLARPWMPHGSCSASVAVLHGGMQVAIGQIAIELDGPDAMSL